jgi:hypothetical protein
MRVIPLVPFVCLAWACGTTLPVTLTATPASSPPDAMACARKKLTALGYRQVAYDEVDLRVVARKQDPTAHRADPQFRYNTDQIEATAAPGADGKTALTVQGRTIAMLDTHRGPTEEEEQASSGVKEAAQAVLDACGKS